MIIMELKVVRLKFFDNINKSSSEQFSTASTKVVMSSFRHHQHHQLVGDHHQSS